MANNPEWAMERAREIGVVTRLYSEWKEKGFPADPNPDMTRECGLIAEALADVDRAAYERGRSEAVANRVIVIDPWTGCVECVRVKAAREEERKRCLWRARYHGICGTPGKTNPEVSVAINCLAAWQSGCGAVEKSIESGEWIPEMEEAMKKEEPKPSEDKSEPTEGPKGSCRGCMHVIYGTTPMVSGYPCACCSRNPWAEIVDYYYVSPSPEAPAVGRRDAPDMRCIKCAWGRTQIVCHSPRKCIGKSEWKPAPIAGAKEEPKS